MTVAFLALIAGLSIGALYALISIESDLKILVSLESDLKAMLGLASSSAVEHQLAEIAIAAQSAGAQVVEVKKLLESVVRTEAQLEVLREQSRVAALEPPQVPKPHGAAKTLLLMNKNRSVAHEVTWHRDVPKSYAYAGRVFELFTQNKDGAWEYFPC